MHIISLLRRVEWKLMGVQVRPLRRQLKGLKAWITGQRKDQSPGTRSAVPVVQVFTCTLGGALPTCQVVVACDGEHDVV